jgi:adenylate cyclase
VPVEIGIGIATGPAIAGGYRAHGRIAYGVTGDCAILADRLKALSAQYGLRTLVAGSTKENVLGFAFLEVDTVALDGHGEPIRLYAMLGDPVTRAAPKFRALSTFHEHIFQAFRAQQWQKTRGLIEQASKLSGASQKLYDLLLARIAHFEAHPPASDWDGAYRP